MKVFVVYESMFGNTEAIARAVAHGLGAHIDVELHDVAEAALPDGAELIVAGGPTHAFSLSRPNTRAEAISQGATHGTKEIGLREWLTQLPRALHSELFAAFDTRVEKVRRLPGSATTKSGRIARHLGYTPAGHESFYVSGTPGPLVPGELERATDWGAQLATQLERAQGGTLV
ncbi:MAG: hypothetical protein ABI083_20030 [Lapillicoccus sp.]